VARLNQVLPELRRPHGVLGPAFDTLTEQVPKEPCVTGISMRTIEVAAALARQAKQ
ncbi:putative phage protein, partial [Bordetella avium 197N]